MQPIEILFEDYYLMVVNKPRGIATDLANPSETSVKSLVLDYLNKKHPDRKKHQVGIPHRIDKPVGGLVVVTKTPQALKNLNEQFASRLVTKKYMGWVEGNMSSASGTLEHWIGRNDTRKKAVVSNTEQNECKPCSLTYTVRKHSAAYSLLEIELNTGRYHQIRAQFSFTGHPVAGDELYGAQKRNEPGIMLWSVQLSFSHPKTGEPLNFELDAAFISNAF
ncbi:MAG: RluA family pseudouridine synthase [Flavobacteriales bacterium]